MSNDLPKEITKENMLNLVDSAKRDINNASTTMGGYTAYPQKERDRDLMIWAAIEAIIRDCGCKEKDSGNFTEEGKYRHYRED